MNTHPLTRIFECENGHRYKSRQPITTKWAERFGFKANDRCKVCKAIIIKEEGYVNGSLVMGSMKK